MKKVLAVSLAASLTLAMGTGAMAEEEKKYTIGFEPYTLTNEYFVAVQDGFMKASAAISSRL